MGLSAAAFLAACGGGGGGGSKPGPSSSLPPIAGNLSVAQWPLYIDRSHGTFPTILAFQKEFGIKVNYQEIINDNLEWFAKLYPQLSAGQDTSWDLMCVADWVIHRFDLGSWIEPLHWDALPTANANMLPAFRDPVYDPNNAHSVPWQGGTTGIAYNPKLTGRKLTAFADLWDPKLAGHVGMMTEMVDSMSLTLLMLGVEPQQATLDDAKRAQQKLLEQRNAGIVRKYYGQDYIDALSTGDIWASMAWSGDVFYHKYVVGDDLEFVVPDEGGMIWASADAIPNLAAHPADAHAFMDFYFRPEIAVQVTDWVLYMTPVKGVQELMAQKAQDAKQTATKKYYETLSQSPMLFPPANLADANLHEYKAYSEDEFQRYEDLFQQVLES